MEAEMTGRSEKAVIDREFRSDERRQHSDQNIAPAGNVCEQSGQVSECVYEQETRTKNTKTMDRGKPYRIEGENRAVHPGYPQKAKEKRGRQRDRCQRGSWSLVRSRGKDALSAEHDDEGRPERHDDDGSDQKAGLHSFFSRGSYGGLDHGEHSIGWLLV